MKCFEIMIWFPKSLTSLTSSQKPKFCEREIEIAQNVHDILGLKAKWAPDLKSEKFWKVLGRTKYCQYRWNKLKSVHWIKIEAFINYRMSNFGKLNLFPPFSIWPIRLRSECCYTSFSLDHSEKIRRVFRTDRLNLVQDLDHH